MVRAEGADGFDVSFADGALTLSGALPDSGSGDGALLRFRHTATGAKHVFVSHLAPEDGFVMGDHAFRSPTIAVANDKVALAFIPDLYDVSAIYLAGARTWMDYDHKTSELTFAIGAYRIDGHVFYRKDALKYRGQSLRLRVHVLVSTKRQDIANPWGLAARFHWRRWGASGLASGGSQTAPFDVYAAHGARWAFSNESWGETVWQEFSVDGVPCGGPAFIVDVVQHPSTPKEKRCWREPKSIWNQAWFSTQRCANGMWRQARRNSDDDLKRRARLTTNLALAAPQNGGLFPAVYETRPENWRPYTPEEDVPTWDQGHWTNSDRKPREASREAYHILDAAFTAQQLLEWHDLTGDPETLAYVTRFADALVRLQRPSGAFPGWVEPNGDVVPTLAEGPESAVGATLLLLLAQRDLKRTDFREAARKCLAYLESGPIADRRWEDFETYFSCCRWGADRIGKRVERNGVFKSNTLSMFWCAEAFLAGYRTFGDKRLLHIGRRCLDELSLYQQVWDPPFIPARCHGGFGVMNADGEWNDARQSLFAPLYFEYGKATGEREYYERGVAALRASFAMMYCPENERVKRQYELRHRSFGPESYGFMMENIAHCGPAPANGSAIGRFTIFTWGNGAAMAAAAKIRDLYGDVYVDLEHGAAIGIDGCLAEMSDGQIKVQDPFKRGSVEIAFSSGQRQVLTLADGAAAAPIPQK